jgi:hypothetical protein
MLSQDDLELGNSLGVRVRTRKGLGVGCQLMGCCYGVSIGTV